VRGLIDLELLLVRPDASKTLSKIPALEFSQLL